MIKMKIYVLLVMMMVCGARPATAQTAPDGKKPFYINHYGCPTEYYLDKPESYEAPYKTLAKADSLGKLTPLGSDVLRRVGQMRNAAYDRNGELTPKGKLQAREFAGMLRQQFPEVFAKNMYCDSRCYIKNNCMMTLGEVTLQLLRFAPMQGNIDASGRFQNWMFPHDEVLEKQRTDSLTMKRYAEFATRWAPDNKRLMAALFNDAAYAKSVDGEALGRQLFELKIDDVFTPEERHRHWLLRNAMSYIRYGACKLNGGNQPFLQRRPLLNLLHQGDSILTIDRPVLHLRFTHESVVLSLACLMELDGYGVQTDCLDSLEAYGWIDDRIASLGGSMMLIHYRSEKNDPDPLVRVLLNGKDATLPITTDCAPFYHWADVKHYYLRKLYAYAKATTE
jgi:hypothetical protein